MAEPVIDVASVTVFPTNLPCAVYGRISASDKLDSTLPTYILYERDAEHPELISESGQALSHIDLNKILFLQQPVISFSLKGVEDGAFIASGYVELDIETNNDYEQVKKSDVKGDCGWATVNYIALSSALLADLNIVLSNNSYLPADVQEVTVGQQVKCSLYGSIVAHYGTTFGRTGDFHITLLNVPSDQSIPIFFEYPQTPSVKLTRNLVSVPAYSTLHIKANLRSTLSGLPVNEDTVILVPRNWRAFTRIVDEKLTNRCNSVFNTWNDWPELFSLEPSSRQTLWKSVDSGGDFIFELFSVFIGRENDRDLKISGTITLEDNESESEFVIFNRDDSNPDQLLGGRKLLTITCPSIKFFSLDIDLMIKAKLTVDDCSFIKDDFASFRTTFIEDWEQEFDRHLCSVLRGDNDIGYCAVHYSVFKSAARVGFKIVLLCKGVDVAKVHGKIVAWSDIFDYRRDYDKKYYRRVVYDEPEDRVYHPRKVASKKENQRSLDEHNLGEVELSESCVAVPLTFSYNLGVDLYVSSRTSSSPSEHLHKTFSFQLPEGKHEAKQMMEILGGDFVLRIQKILS